MKKHLLSLATTLAFTTIAPAQPSWDVYADTWVATDGIGRTLPTSADVGAPRANRDVGTFYFLWLGSNEPEAKAYNLTQIMAEHPDALQPGKGDSVLGSVPSFHYWNEPIWGYYNIEDPAIIRKHAQMLSDSGVDMLLFDTSNSFNYPEAVNALTRVYHQMKAEGMKVPQLAFHTVPGAGEQQITQIQQIYDAFYKSGENDDLWYRWQGKPLIIADPDQTLPEGLSEYFTFRRTYWAGKNPGPNSWDLDGFYPLGDAKHIQRNKAGELEQMAVPVSSSIIYAPVSLMGPGAGRSWHKTQKDGYRDMAPDAIFKGIQFQDNWDFALKEDPLFILTYSWNEWIVQRYQNQDGTSFFVDQFTNEFSKDIEPMKGGFGDAYYYQQAANIRRYKGARAAADFARQNFAGR